MHDAHLEGVRSVAGQGNQEPLRIFAPNLDLPRLVRRPLSPVRRQRVVAMTFIVNDNDPRAGGTTRTWFIGSQRGAERCGELVNTFDHEWIFGFRDTLKGRENVVSQKSQAMAGCRAHLENLDHKGSQNLVVSCHSFLIPYGFIPSSALQGVRARKQD